MKLLTPPYVRKLNSNNEMMEYLDMSLVNIGANDIRNDVAEGATPFAEIAKSQNTVDFTSRVTLIRTTGKEVGLMAIAYLTGIHRALDFPKEECDEEMEEQYEEMFCDDEDFCDDCDEGWLDSYYRLPIIEASEANYDDKSTLYQNGGNQLYAMNTGYVKPEPYWKEQHSGPIILVNETYGFQSMLNAEDIISRFETNRRIYWLEIESCMDEDIEDEVNPNLLSMIVRNDATVFRLDHSESREKEYLHKIMKQMAENCEMSFASDFPQELFIDKIYTIFRDMRADFIDKLIRRAKNRNEKAEIGNETFGLIGKIAGKNGKLRGWKLLDSMVGMESVKHQVNSLVNAMKIAKKRRSLGYETDVPMVVGFLGAPGTSKTTVAQALSDIMFDEGILKGQRFLSTTGAGLEGRYLGETQHRIREMFANNDVIFIDEAYSLASDVEKDLYAKQALATLCCELEDALRNGNKLVILAGYGGSESADEDNPMKAFLESNPGIKSRISCSIEFKSYSAKETTDIFFGICRKNKYQIADDERERIEKELISYFGERAKDRAFGNGREARALVAEASRCAGERILSEGKNIGELTESELQSLCCSDVIRAIQMSVEMRKAQEGKGERKTQIAGFA